MILGLILGFCIGWILSNIVPDEDFVPTGELSLEESIKLSERVMYGEPYISVEEAEALKNVIEYCKSQLDKEDDLK